MPELPPIDSPMRGYAEKMTEQVNTIQSEIEVIRFMLFCLMFLAIVSAIAFIVFAWQKWREREELRETRKDIVDMTTACGLILASIKTRTAYIEDHGVARADTVAQAAADLRKCVQEVGSKVESVPDKTAAILRDSHGDSVH